MRCSSTSSALRDGGQYNDLNIPLNGGASSGVGRVMKMRTLGGGPFDVDFFACG